MEEEKKVKYSLPITLLGISALIFGILAMFFSVALGFPGYGAYIFGFPAIISGILTMMRGSIKWKIIGLAGTAFALIGIFMLTSYMTNTRCDECGCLRQAKDAKIKNSIWEIISIAETIYHANDGDFSSLCKSNNILNYSADKKLESITNNIIICGGSIPKCFASEKKYCISSTLNDGTPVCINSDGHIGKVVCASADSICD